MQKKTKTKKSVKRLILLGLSSIFIIVVTTFLGLEHKNAFIIPLSDRICHRLMNSISINI